MELITLDFCGALQDFGALQEAAYRLIDRASVEFETIPSGFRCRLIAKPDLKLSASELKHVFLDFVTDENIRLKIESQTAPTRNLLLALAFGGFSPTIPGSV